MESTTNLEGLLDLGDARLLVDDEEVRLSSLKTTSYTKEKERNEDE